ncbi:MAG: tol-pal system YbgF family protein [Thiohalomonadales bacterium]
MSKLMAKKALQETKGYSWKQFHWLLLVSLIFPGSHLYASSLQEIKALQDNGAISLALRLINKHQEIYINQPKDWMSWEHERINIYQANKNWMALAQRVKNYSDKITYTDEFISWSNTQAAKALLKLSKASDARNILLKLIWSSKERQKNWMETWRRLVIESYVTDSMIQEAQIAILRFKQDYGEQSIEDRLLRARIMILNGQSADAMEILAVHAKLPQAGMLYLLAQLRSKSRAPQKVQQAALRHMRGDWVSEELESQLWAVVAEAAQMAGDSGSAAEALERALVSYRSDLHNSKLFKISSDTLWNVYFDFAKKIGNNKLLLVGEDTQWLEAAKKAEKKSAIASRSLSAFVMLKGRDEKNRTLAAQNFVRLLSSRKNGKQLIYRLFLESEQFEDYNIIPEIVRHGLVDQALAKSNLKQASELMATITKPPEGTSNSYMWQLRRARILVLGGNAIQGSAALNDLIQKNEIKDQEKIDNLLQVIFDLQSVKEHELAYQLLEKSLSLNKKQQFQREIIYWMADSRKAQLRFDDAAYLYLKSAMMPEPSTMDDWAQSARYQAAGSLVDAGLASDARGLYQQLLSVTKKPSRRAVLVKEIQKLNNNRAFVKIKY